MEIKIKVDSLGRIVIPAPIRKELNIENNSSIVAEIKNKKFIVGKQKKTRSN